MKWWALVRDILLTGTAIFIIVWEAFAKTPDEPLLVVALALVAPSIADHAKALLSAPGAGVPSQSVPAQPQPPSSSESEG